jgi:hypothetical protein
MAIQSRGFLRGKGGSRADQIDSAFNHASDHFFDIANTQHNNSTDAANVGTVIIPRNTLRAGSVIKVTSAGTCVSTNSTNTLTPVPLLTGAALDVADNDIVSCESTILITSIGTTGTFTATSKFNTDAAGVVTKAGIVASTTVDTTTEIFIHLNVDWSVANADNQYTHLLHTAQIYG